MLEPTTRILMQKYQPTNPLLQWAYQPEVVGVKQAEQPIEASLALLQEYNITTEDIMKKREQLFKSWGLDITNRHEWADELISSAVVADARAALFKSAKSEDGKVIKLVMSSEEYTDKQITEAVTAYNQVHPEHMSYSFQLPTTMYGFPANSWVLVLPDGDKQ